MSTHGKIRLALPSKGEIEGPTLRFLAECGIKVSRSNPRQYLARIEGMPEVEVIFQRVADIAALVQNGHATFGITGYDLFAEHCGNADRKGESAQNNGSLLILERNLGYGVCRLVVAVPETWSDMRTCGDLWHLSNSYRQQNRVLRVATKYPRLAEQFLRCHDISCTVLSPQGALEAAPLTDTADFIVDLTATGTTLRENRLKELDDGEILLAQACLFANGRLLKSDNHALQIAITLLELIDAHALAHAQSILTATLPFYTIGDFPSFRERFHDRLAEMYLSPAQIALAGSRITTASGCMLSAVVRSDSSSDLLETVALLRTIGASSITTTPLTYRFLEESSSVRLLREQLERMI